MHAPQRRSVLLVWLLCAVLPLAGCALVPSVGSRPSSEERQAFDAAAAEATAQPERAREVYQAFANAYPEGALFGEAQLRLGDLSAEAGDTEAALLAWYRGVRSASSPAADRARIRIARAELDRGQPDEAREVLSKVRFTRLEADERRDAYALLAETAPDPVAQVRWLSFQRAETSPEEVEAVDVELDALLATLDTPNLARIARQLGDTPPAARVWLVRAERSLDDGNLERAGSELERARDIGVAERDEPRALGIEERLAIRLAGPSDVAELPSFAAFVGEALPDTTGARGSLGVVLPLSGPFARFGEESLRGILLAARVFGGGDGSDDGALRVVVRDSAGDPARAGAAVRDLASDPDVRAIVGPLLSAESEAAALAAQEVGIPLLALTAREEIAQGRDFVFRLRTRPTEEAQVLVERARAAGAQRFAILYRDDNYGRGLRALFWDAVEARGGEVVAVSSFDPKATDFAKPIRDLVGYSLLSSEEKRLLRQRESMLGRARRLPTEEARALRRQARGLTGPGGSPLPPIVDFDALFIAESYENVVLIAPQLAFHEVVGARLLGPDGWYHPDLLRVGREHVEGSIFVAHYFPNSPTPYVRHFADRYRDAFGHESDVFAAQAYDAANLVFVQLARGFETPQALRDGVLATEAYPGVSGVLSMRSDGNAQKRPFVLGVERGGFVQYDD